MAAATSMASVETLDAPVEAALMSPSAELPSPSKLPVEEEDRLVELLVPLLLLFADPLLLALDALLLTAAAALLLTTGTAALNVYANCAPPSMNHPSGLLRRGSPTVLA